MLKSKEVRLVLDRKRNTSSPEISQKSMLDISLFSRQYRKMHSAEVEQGTYCLIRCKDSFDDKAQHTDAPIDYVKAEFVITAPNERKVSYGATQSG